MGMGVVQRLYPLIIVWPVSASKSSLTSLMNMALCVVLNRHLVTAVKCRPRLIRKFNYEFS
jgi:hypothetical protein